MFNSLFSYAKQNKRIQLTFLALFLPLLACFIFALLQGVKLGDLFLPASEWNDEILYFKQIEGVVEKGAPLGYFGYNESTAARMTFSAWSPVIMLAYVIWGKLFGWGYFAPILCNLFIFSLGLAFLVWQTRMDEVHFRLLAAFVILFTPFARFTMSVMADMELLTILFVYMGCYFCADRESRADGKASTGKVLGMIICSVLLTLMRPYFVLFFAFPVYFVFKDKLWKAFASALTAVVSVAAYFYIAANYTAAYFTPIIQTDWLNNIRREPVGGVKEALRMFFYGLRAVFIECVDGITDGKMEGNLWLLFVVLFIVLAIRSIRDKACRAWLGIMILLFGAIIMFYDVHIGSRHLITMILPIALVILLNKNTKAFLGIIAVVLLSFTIRINADAYNYKLPAYDASEEKVIAELANQLSDKLVINDAADPWDNTVIWLFADETAVKWQNLYCLPEGVGINLCLSGYVRDNLKNLKAGYIAVNAGESIDRLCEQAGYRKVAQAGGMVIRKIR